MPTTSNFGWNTPADTDLVKDGAAAIRTLGNNIDASLVDLKGGTTNQVLAKNSDTDLDFKWVADASGIPATIFDAKGDLIAASAADTAARLAVGTNGQYLSANSATSTGLEWVTPTSGGMTLLASGSHTGTTLTLNSISQDYQQLFLVLQSIDLSGVGGDNSLRMRYNNDANTRYRYMGPTSSNVATFASTEMLITDATENDLTTTQAIITIPNYANTVSWKVNNVVFLGPDASTNTSVRFGTGYNFYNQTTAISRLDIFEDSGQSFTLSYRLYGVK